VNLAHQGDVIMTAIAVSEFRAKLMEVLKQIENGATINITSRGKVIARLVPPDYSREIARKKLNEISRTAKLHDATSPIDVQWEAMEL
jgi:prevent-host-death family protein